MERRTFVAGAGMVAAGSLAGCVDDLVGEPVTEEFSSSHDASEETTVSVSNRNGPVTVQPVSGDRVTLAGEKRASSREGLDSIAVDVVEGERFAITVRFTGESDFSNRRVDLTVGVPDVVTVDLASTANGDVTATGVGGDLDATTANGNVEVTDVDGFVRGESTNGNVHVRNTSGLTGARTTNGDVDVELRSMRGDVTCSSSNGDVTVRVGPDVSAGIQLRTNTGTATVRDLPHTTTTDRTGYVAGGLRGGDSPVLSLRTDNGDVTLRPA